MTVSTISGNDNRGTTARSGNGLLRMEAVTVILCFISATLSGVSPIPTIITTFLIIIVSAYAILFRTTYSRLWILPIVYYLYAAISGIVFGGFAAIWEGGFAAWAAGEGRIFLYFWPFIYYVTRPASRMAPLSEGEWSLLFRTVSLIVFAATAIEFIGVFGFYSSHHIAGTVLGCLLIVNYFTFLHKFSWTNFLFLALNLVLFLGSNSRTSIIAVLAAIFLVHLFRSRWQSAVVYIILVATAAPLMQAAFPTEFSRLTSTFEHGTGTSMATNFREAVLADTPRESSAAWDVSNFGRLEGNANLAIRGFLWGRAVREFLGSPIIGIGFGRYNDTGRVFTNVLVGEAAVEAAYNNPSAHNAHNSYLHISAEMGLLGIAIIVVLFVTLLRHWMSEQAGSDRYWSSIGLATMFALLISGATDHSLGAPAFGFTYLAVVGLSYFQTRAKVNAI